MASHFQQLGACALDIAQPSLSLNPTLLCSKRAVKNPWHRRRASEASGLDVPVVWLRYGNRSQSVAVVVSLALSSGLIYGVQNFFIALVLDQAGLLFVSDAGEAKSPGRLS